MKTVHKIMVAVDFSCYSQVAAEYAARLAQDIEAKLLLTHVFNQRDIYMMDKAALRFPEFSATKQAEDWLKDREQRMSDLVRKINRNNLDVETHIRIGVPYEALLREIEEKKPDLLVMGAKGRSNVVDMILGSCAQKMFRHSPIPLLSIRNR